MTVRAYIRRILLAALIALALGGLLLHSRSHPLAENRSFLVPFFAGLLGLFVVPVLYLFRQTIAYGYVLNGFLAIAGTVSMVHFSLSVLPSPATLQAIVYNTLIAEILILWGKFFVGKALFDLETFGYDTERPKVGASHRYPHLGWWMMHLVAVGLVYFLGNRLWRS